jgi:hypothetical protein
MSLFRRKYRSESTDENSVSAYAEAESNTELLAAEAEVNGQSSITRLLNPVNEDDTDPDIWVADDEDR